MVVTFIWRNAITDWSVVYATPVGIPGSGLYSECMIRLQTLDRL